MKEGQITTRMLDDYPTLRKMDESLKSGKLISTTRAVDFSVKDIEDYVRSATLDENTQPQGMAYTANVVADLGGDPRYLDAESAIQTVLRSQHSA